MEPQNPVLLTDPSYDSTDDHVFLSATQPDGAQLSFTFPAEDSGKHLHGWLTAIQNIAEHDGAVGLGEVAQKMIVLQPTELAMAGVGPGRAAVVFAFGPVKLAFLLATDQLAALLEETRKEVG